MHLSRVSAPIAAAAVLATLAGCGSGATDATAKTASQDTVTPVVAMQRVADSSRSVDSASYTFALDGTGGLAIGAKGSGSYQTKPLAMQMVFDTFSVAGQAIPGGMEERIVGDTMYLRTGLLGGLLGGKAGDSWMKIPLSAADGQAGLQSMLSQARQVDPREQLQLLLASKDVHEVGHEKVNGVDTTHYAAQLTPDELAAESKLDDETRTQLQKSYSSAGLGKIGIDVWVDSQDRARRFVTTAPTSAGDMRMTLNFTDYGKPLEIVAPEGASDFGIGGLMDNLTHSKTGAAPKGA